MISVIVSSKVFVMDNNIFLNRTSCQNITVKRKK